MNQIDSASNCVPVAFGYFYSVKFLVLKVCEIGMLVPENDGRLAGQPCKVACHGDAPFPRNVVIPSVNDWANDNVEAGFLVDLPPYGVLRCQIVVLGPSSQEFPFASRIGSQ